MSAPAVSAGGLRVGELARAAGVNVQTLRYYERRGLLAAPVRSPGGHRVYPPETVDRLWAIKTAQRLGFSLAEIAELLRTGRQQHLTGGLPERAAGKLAEIDRKIADLQAIRTALAQVIEARCDSLTNCTCPESVLETGHRSPQPGTTTQAVKFQVWRERTRGAEP